MRQSTLKETLANDLSEGRVTTVVGTGISIASTNNQEIEGCAVATWLGLLCHGVEHIKQIGLADEFDVNLLSMQINSGRTDHVISAAETITNKMKSRGQGVYRGWLKNTIGALRVSNKSIIEAIGELPGVIATLNYDNLIEDVTGRQAVTWLKNDEIEDVLTGQNDDAVIHLHGWYREPESVVLGTSSYLGVKDHAHAKSVLQHFTIGRTLLFIGCGATFEDPNFTQLIRWSKEAISDVTPRHYVLCRSSELSGFQKMLEAAPWLQPLSYGDTYDSLPTFLKSLAAKKRKKTKGAPRTSSLDLGEYRRAMLTRYRRLKIEQLDPTTHDIRPLTLNALYIDQHAKECTTIVPKVFELPKELQHQLRRKGELQGTEFDDATLAQYRRAYVDGAPRLVSDILADTSFSKVVILGDPGSGKSTLLQHAILQWAETGTTEENGQGLPLLIELREFARYIKQSGSEDFFSYLQDGTGIRWHLDADVLKRWLKEQNSLVLFDGLDEIFDLSQRREITTSIHRFAHEYPLARIVVTSRVVGYQHQAWNDEGFRQFMLQDLDQEKIEVFLRRWHQAAYEEFIDGEKKRSLLEGAIKDSAAIRQLAGNPLLLTMMAVLNRTQDLPRDRAELYEQCARLLLHQWKVDVAFQTDPDLANASLDFKDKRGLLLRVARAMHSGERGLAGNLIEEETLESTLAAGLNEIRVSRPDRAARSLIEQLRGRNFMLCFMGGRSYAFVHRTFLEYFCALEIRDRFEKERSLSLEQLECDIFGHWQDEIWHEVLCLLAGMISAKFAEKIIQWLITQSDPNATRHNIFVALRCLGEIRNRTTTMQTEITLRQMAKGLSIYEPTFPAQPWTVEGQLVAEVRQKALKMISAIWPDDPDNSRWFKHVALLDDSWDVPQIAVRLLVQGWRDDRNTLAWLRDQVVSKGQNNARISAIAELTRGWNNDVETRATLLTAFKMDRDESTRASALQGLAKIDSEDAGLVDYLLEVANNDKSYYVSYMAMQILIGSCKKDERVFSCLIGMLSSPRSLQRHLGFQMLARNWIEHPDVSAALLNAVENEADTAVLNSVYRLIFDTYHDRNFAVSLAKKVAVGKGEYHIRQRAIDLLAEEGSDQPGTFDVIKSCVASSTPIGVRAHAVRKLAAWSEKEDVFTFLIDLVSSRQAKGLRDASLKSLAETWGEVQEVRDLLFNVAENDRSMELRVTAIKAIAYSKIAAAEKLEFLKKIISAAGVAVGILVKAIDGIAQFIEDDPGIYKILTALVAQNNISEVRLAALTVVIRHCSSYPDTLPLLKEIVLKDKNAEIRLPAVAELSRRASEDNEIFSILRDVIKADRSKLVRMRAIRELARRWPSNSEVVALIKERRKLDTNKDVSKTADIELNNLSLMH